MDNVIKMQPKVDKKFSPSFFGDIFVILNLWNKNKEPLFLLPTTKKMVHRIPQKNWENLIDEEIKLGLTYFLDAKENFFFGVERITINDRKIIEILKFECGKFSEFKPEIKRVVKHFHMYENVLLNLLENKLFDNIKEVDNENDHLMMNLSTDLHNKFFETIVKKYGYKSYSEYI